MCGVHSDELGNMLMIDIKINYTNYLLLNIYGPNTDNPVFFFENIQQSLQNRQYDHLIWCGDFNITVNHDLDTYNYVGLNNSRAGQTVLDVIEELSHVDTYRYFHPDCKRSTWRKKIL